MSKSRPANVVHAVEPGTFTRTYCGRALADAPQYAPAALVRTYPCPCTLCLDAMGRHEEVKRAKRSA